MTTQYLQEVKPFIGTTMVWSIPMIELADLGITVGNPPDSFTYKITGVDVDDPVINGIFEYNAITGNWEASMKAPSIPGIYTMWAHAIKGLSDGKWSATFRILPFHGN
jgi:hypothetical protein